mgnify:CR=1 FL=1
MMYIRKSWGNPAFFFAIRWGIHIKAESKCIEERSQKQIWIDSKNIDGGNYYETSKILWSDM